MKKMKGFNMLTTYLVSSGIALGSGFGSYHLFDKNRFVLGAFSTLVCASAFTFSSMHTPFSLNFDSANTETSQEGPSTETMTLDDEFSINACFEAQANAQNDFEKAGGQGELNWNCATAKFTKTMTVAPTP